jgi:NADH-quinone oxidoreductase subunit K
MMHVGLTHYLTLGAILFALGLFIVMSRRNAIVMLMGVELILNSAALNFVAFSKYGAADLSGQLMTIFIIVLAAAEAAVALAIVLAIFRNFQTVHVEQVDRLRH